MFRSVAFGLALIMAFSLHVSAESNEEARQRLQEEIASCQQRKEEKKVVAETPVDLGLHSVVKKDEYPQQSITVEYSDVAAMFGYGNVEEQQDLYNGYDVSKYSVWGVLYDSSTIIQPYSYQSYVQGNGSYVVGCSDDEFVWLKYIVAAEAGNQGLTGMQMVAEVVVNRVLDSRFPNTIQEVIFAPGQFTPVSDGAFYTAYNNLPQSIQLECDTAVRNALAGSSIAQGAIYFRTAHYHDNTTPIMQYGAHYFSK